MCQYANWYIGILAHYSLSNRSKLYDTIIEMQKLADSRKEYHRSSIAQLFNLRSFAF